MIRYNLKCEENHDFESWFQSASSFDQLVSAGMVTCPFCGTTEVEKAIMAPRVQTARGKSQAPIGDPAPADPGAAAANRTMHALTAPSSPAEEALQELKKKIQENSEYVGQDFAKEARKIHDGDAPERSIYGEAKPEDARKLVEDGVPVAPLPFVPNRKQN